MLESGATYPHQLNVLLNVIAHLVQARQLPDAIRGVLNRLRPLRNDMLHEGKCEPQDRRAAAEHLAAVVFAVEYSRYVHEVIASATVAG